MPEFNESYIYNIMLYVLRFNVFILRCMTNKCQAWLDQAPDTKSQVFWVCAKYYYPKILIPNGVP